MGKIKPLGIYSELLTFNSKQQKTYEKTGVVQVGLELSSGTVDGVAMCPTAVARDYDCQKPGACVKFGGNGRFTTVELARLRRSRELIADRRGFEARLKAEIEHCSNVAALKGIELAVRLNTFSDQTWMRLIRQLPGVRFFDYTKERRRFNRFMNGDLPSNYDLTFSMSETSRPSDMLKIVERGFNVSVLYYGAMPTEYLGKQVIDGDSTDARWLDPKGVFVGLSGKAGMRSESFRNSKFLRIVNGEPRA